MLCKISFYVLALQSFQVYKEYIFERQPFIGGSDPDLHYFSAADVEKIKSLYINYLNYLNNLDYHNQYNVSDVPDYSLGFKTVSGVYSFLYNSTSYVPDDSGVLSQDPSQILTVITDLY
jgi:hypothetical protein